ncbi:hypothetical protein TBLA_0B07400 [Henningerozyma blattae CBS 6284]|uniref:Uncharacterized protein n=1 Tax=Henningerozyma blattae (strain ATCC 34711 / CBS 6284 / DSM 70876 / NBRC 10599 / NRRL Y-10934 / UCD 77-7) TaxID=1071380 RepID=I2GZK6_HENB6|nr:hypothetical protein TBLA_0B07400 [Tetrapisispora blattae CBS 6284]CCH59558.1 hypothetical protein TBLA_0B07400 [Tetrapisispora blattae CBS 6284]
MSSEKYPLHHACMENKFDTAKELIKENPELLLTRDDDDRLPIHWAVSMSSTDIVHLLLDSFPPKAPEMFLCKDEGGWTPYHICSSIGSVEILKKLEAFDVENGHKVDWDIQTKQGMTCLHLAISKKHDAVVTYLLRNGESVRIPDKTGKLPLHRAAALGNIELARILIKHNSPVNKKDSWNVTPIEQALLAGHIKFALDMVHEFDADYEEIDWKDIHADVKKNFLENV